MSESTQATLIPYDDMLKAGMHFGRKKSVFNPAMGQFVFTVRDGISIIDLLKTQSQLKEAAEFLKKIKADGGIILFVAITKQSSESMKKIAETLGMPYVVDRWLGGTLTNFKSLNGRVKKLEEMEMEAASSQLDKYTKKEKLMFNRELEKMRVKFQGLKKLNKLPDVIFVSSLKESALPVKEAKLTGVKVVAIANTDSNPKQADYIVPANDKSKKSIDLIIEAIGNTI